MHTARIEQITNYSRNETGVILALGQRVSRQSKWQPSFHRVAAKSAVSVVSNENSKWWRCPHFDFQSVLYSIPGELASQTLDLRNDSSDQAADPRDIDP